MAAHGFSPRELSRITELEVLGVLTQLVEKSLVVYEEDDQGRGRYRLLETVRWYVHDQLLDSGDGEGGRDRHLAYFLALAEEAYPHLVGLGPASVACATGGRAR